MIEIRPKGTSLPALSASRTVTGSHKVDLSEHNGAIDSDIAETAKTKAVKDDPDDAYHPVSPPAVRAPAQTAAIPPPAPAALPTVVAPKNDIAGDRSLVRVLGLKLGRVVIDAGHGGHDSGTVGPNGLMEKELVLDVAQRLGALITKQMGAEVIYTRSTDVFIPLEERTKIANDQKADLFISVHANSSSEPSATGVETYYFNLTSDKSGLDLATRENASADSAISDLNDLLHKAVLQTKKEESREFAQRVQASLCAAAQKTSSHPVDRGVRQAPFVVLIGATMPSILAEIGFVSNPHDEKLLRRTDQRQKIADALYKGVLQYANSLSHLQMARAGTE
jgi:N-acetylmuramoyl-L-alanine amidase